jgi:hypothetical protein
MKIEFTIGTSETIDVVIETDRFTGRFTCTANGQVCAVRDVSVSGAQLGIRLKEVYTVAVGTTEKQLITIERRRPLLFAAIRPHEYTVTVDGKVVGEYQGQ